MAGEALNKLRHLLSALTKAQHTLGFEALTDLGFAAMDFEIPVPTFCLQVGVSWWISSGRRLGA